MVIKYHETILKLNQNFVIQIVMHPYKTKMIHINLRMGQQSQTHNQKTKLECNKKSQNFFQELNLKICNYYIYFLLIYLIP